jgi:hypothetical protein
MDAPKLEGFIAAVIISFENADLPRTEQIEILNATLERLVVLEEVEQEALRQIVYGVN